MTPTEAAQLLAHAAAFDNRKPSAAASQAWAAALHDVPLDADALAAVARYYGIEDPQASGQRWIQPHHVRANRKTIRAERLEGFQYIPTPGHTDYLADLRAQLAAVADGRRPPAPAALSPSVRRADDVRELLAGVFSELPTAAEPITPQAAETAEEFRTRRSAEAYGYLLAIPDEAADEAMAKARAQLGDEADRREVVLLAAKLVDAKPLPPSLPDKATRDLLAEQGCPNGCPLGEHVKPCRYAVAS